MEFEDEAALTGKLDGLDEIDGLLEEETDLQLTHPSRITVQIKMANIFFIANNHSSLRKAQTG